MTKQDTTIMKGIAILFMVWVHCFNQGLNHVLDYQDIVIGGGNLSYLLTRLTRPVEFYVILSGFGLYYTFSNAKNIGSIKRLGKLYGLYAFTLLIFVTLVSFMGIDGYPGSLTDVVTNMTGWNTTYNSTIWFLFPYAVMVAIAGSLFRVFDGKPFLTLVGSTTLYFGAYLTSWMSHHGHVDLGYTLNEVLRVLNMILPFMIGAALCKYSIVSKAKALFANKQRLLLLSLIMLCAIRLSTDFDFMLQLVYATSLLVLVSSARKPDWVSNILSFFGKYSTTMWLVHAYFIWYLFDEYPYTLKYPVLIFGVSFMESLLTAIIIDWCYHKINQLLQTIICKKKLKS